MFIRYSKWTDQSMTSEQRLKHLLSLFSYLLLKTSGDVKEALEWMRMIGKANDLFDAKFTFDDFVQKLKELGYIEESKDMLILTTKGVQRIRQDALNEIFNNLKKGPILGFHETPHSGEGVDRLSETRPYQFGDQPTNIDLTSTVTNALIRDGVDDFTIREEDLQVYETEFMTSCATVILLDISHSMILYGEDRITPAKQVSLALAELIKSKFPKDKLYIVVFGDDAKLITLSELPFISAGPYHTNTKAALQLARHLLRKEGNVNKQIFLVTDGKPSAIFEPDGRLYKNSFGLDPKIVNKTLDEAVACRREKITICTFMVAKDPYLINFVEELTKSNRGRAYYSSLDKLGEFVFVDYIRNRRKRIKYSL